MILGVTAALLHTRTDTFTLLCIVMGFHLASLRIKLTIAHECTGAIALVYTLHALMKILSHLFQSGVGFIHLHLEGSMLHR